MIGITLIAGELEYYVMWGSEVEVSFSTDALRNASAKEILEACKFVTEHESDLDIILGGCHRVAFCGFPGQTEQYLSALYQLKVPKALQNHLEAAIRNNEAILARENLRESRRELHEKVVGYVYLMQSGPHYKIGTSVDPDKRRDYLGTKPPFEIEIVCTIETDDMYGLEAELHERFADKRKNWEWFELEKEDVEYIKELARCQ